MDRRENTTIRIALHVHSENDEMPVRETPSKIYVTYIQYTGLFINPSVNSELDCATTKTDTAERSISIGRESLKVFFCTKGLGVLAGSTARG